MITSGLYKMKSQYAIMLGEDGKQKLTFELDDEFTIHACDKEGGMCVTVEIKAGDKTEERVFDIPKAYMQGLIMNAELIKRLDEDCGDTDCKGDDCVDKYKINKTKSKKESDKNIEIEEDDEDDDDDDDDDEDSLNEEEQSLVQKALSNPDKSILDLVLDEDEDDDEDDDDDDEDED